MKYALAGNVERNLKGKVRVFQKWVVNNTSCREEVMHLFLFNIYCSRDNFCLKMGKTRYISIQKIFRLSIYYSNNNLLCDHVTEKGEYPNLYTMRNGICICFQLVIIYFFFNHQISIDLVVQI